MVIGSWVLWNLHQRNEQNAENGQGVNTKEAPDVEGTAESAQLTESGSVQAPQRGHEYAAGMDEKDDYTETAETARIEKNYGVT